LTLLLLFTLSLSLLLPLLEVRFRGIGVPGPVNWAILVGADGETLSNAVAVGDDGGSDVWASRLRVSPIAFRGGLDAPILTGE